MAPGAVVVGAHANGLGIVRALAARGVRVAVVSTRRFDVAQHSRYAAERHQLQRLHEDQASLVELLEINASRWSGWGVFPSNDDALCALAHQHERLSRSYRLTVQPWEVVAPLVDKDRMHALAQGCGLELPVCYGSATLQTAALPQLRYPVLVKPIQHERLIEAYGAKLFLAPDAIALRAAIERLARVDVAGLVYECVPGPDSNLYVYCVYMDASGEPSPGITVRKLRQNPPFIGGARVAQVVPEEPALREATIALLRRAGFRGMAFAEFKLDPRSGRFVFIEVNGRAVLFNSLLPPTGLDLVAMAWSDFVLGQPLPVQLTGWSGSWIHFPADLYCSFAHRRSEALSLAELAAPYLKAKRFAIWSASDPAPSLAQSLLAGRSALRRVFRRA